MHSVEKREFFSRRKIFREINSLVTYLENRRFHEIFIKNVLRVKFRNFHTVGMSWLWVPLLSQKLHLCS